MHPFAEIEAEIESATGEHLSLTDIPFDVVIVGSHDNVVEVQIQGFEELSRRFDALLARLELRLETDPEYRAKYAPSFDFTNGRPWDK